MKKIILFALLAAFGMNANAQTPPNWIWAKTAKGVSAASSVAVDVSGNIYITGQFSSPSIIFGSTTLINADSANNLNDIFLAKYDANGNVLWAKSASGKYQDYATSVAIDAAGYIYITGWYWSDTLKFDSSNVIYTKNDTLINIFLAKYDTNGNVIWVKSGGGLHNCSDYASSVATDAIGNVYLTGYFSGNTITLGTYTLTNMANFSFFLAKYDSFGNVLWAINSNAGNDDYARSITVDNAGNTYVTGTFDGTYIIFGSDTLSCKGSRDIFLAKYGSNGNLLWAKSAGGTGIDNSNSVVVDATGNVYITGSFLGSHNIIFGVDTLTNTSFKNIFLAKYDTNGNVLWLKSANGNAEANSITLDSLGNIYMTGYFYSDSLIMGSTILTNAGPANNSYNIFLAEFDSNGNVLWAKSAGGTYYIDESNCVVVNTTGNAYITGYFSSHNISFGTTTLFNIDSTTNYFNLFLAKTGSNMGIIELSNTSNISIYPNPTTDNLTIDVSATLNTPATIEISNIQGQVIKQQTTNVETTNIDVSALAKGMYFVKVKTEKGVVVKKFVKE